jgi:hypothetical protein
MLDAEQRGKLLRMADVRLTRAIMQRREFITLFGGGAAAWPLAARAQQNRPARIGVLVLTNADAQSLTLALREGLQTFGYSEGLWRFYQQSKFCTRCHRCCHGERWREA